jgi:hypothetical protein
MSGKAPPDSMRGHLEGGHKPRLVALATRNHHSQRCDHVVAEVDRDGNRAGSERHLLDGCRVSIGQDPVQLGAELCRPVIV